MPRLKYVSVAGDGHAQLTLGELKCNKDSVVYSGCMSKSAQRLYVQNIRELNSVSGRRVSELTWCRTEQLNE